MVRRRSHRRSASPCAYSFNSLGRRHGPITHFYRTRADMKIVLCQWSMPAARLCVAQPRPRATTPRKIAVRGTQIITFSSANVRASAWLELAPRRYVLVCNKSGHYSMGMHTSSLVGGGSDLGCRSHASLKYRSSSAIRRGSVIRLRGATVSSWPGCDFRRAPHFDQSRDANATVVASQAGAQAHPPAVRYLSNGHRNFPLLRRAERLPPACIAPTGVRTSLCARRDGQAHDGGARRPAYRG
ncbi:MAG: hypothetical protein JWQ50_1015 [Caballeronia mineralivorans]|nr:hypothetical protein [Caballeronia mineralivorans]